MAHALLRRNRTGTDSGVYPQAAVTVRRHAKRLRDGGTPQGDPEDYGAGAVSGVPTWVTWLPVTR
jgi:hypothetical protein